MTRKDYVRLARAFAESRPPRYILGTSELRYQWERTLIAIAAELKTDNARFDVERFVQAAHAGDQGFDRLEARDLSRKYAAYIETQSVSQ